ncbi:CHAD domain-containing protein [Oceanibacterium hippocampi]|uniref:CHAD domain protein n=1 Tax=Oceanibacterium hippocampi TaxID=745714 RepID=A0A1Y5U068_9PROT|nr:CHAD domain-containing protein [Oceanibacterium hippocampi]SLN77729.1 CHAD domain protein [Oceanibacterium hippocampi]
MIHAIYRIPDDAGSLTWLARLPTGLTVAKGPASRIDWLFLDSFDWRLFRAGHVLRLAERDGGRRLEWLPDRTAEPALVTEWPGKAPPSWPAELGMSPLAETLAAALDIRALMPVGRATARSREFALLDDNEKTVARLHEREFAARGLAGGRRTGRFRTIDIDGLRGYGKISRRIGQAFRQAGVAALTPTDVVAFAAAANGRPAGGYSGKVDVVLRPGQPASSAARAILRDLLDTIEVNEAGTRRDIDSEFLHDYRVALRRSRSLLKHLSGLLPEAERTRARLRLQRLAASTGETRDLDVYLLHMTEYRKALPKRLGPGIDVLAAHIAAKRGKARQRMLRYFSARPTRQFLADWRRFLEQAPEDADVEDQPGALDFARARIWKVYRRIVRDGAAIDDNSPAEALHELRKRCKDLRYLMEFFRSLFPKRDITVLIGQLKRFQDNLGAFQDYAVQAETLRAYETELRAGDALPRKAEEAIEALVEQFDGRMHAARAEFQARFGRFAGTENDKRFRALFRGDKTRKGIPA